MSSFRYRQANIGRLFHELDRQVVGIENPPTVRRVAVFIVPKVERAAAKLMFASSLILREVAGIAWVEPSEDQFA